MSGVTWNPDYNPDHAPDRKTYSVTDRSPIGFGALKGEKHTVFLLPKNAKYAQWIIDQGESFYFQATRQYIIDKLEECKEQECYSE